MSNHWQNRVQSSGNSGYHSNKQQKSPAAPVCFICQGPHFVVNCPSQQQSQQQSQLANGPHALSYPGRVTTNPLPQSGQWINSQNGQVANPYGSPQPVVVNSQYGAFQHQQHGNSTGSYGPSTTVAPPYPQYGNAPGSYNPQPAHVPYQQYGPTPSVHNPNYQAPYLANSANYNLQHHLPAHNVAPHPNPHALSPAVVGPYHGTKGPSSNPQWKDSQPPSSHSASPYPQQQRYQRDKSMKRESVTPRLQSQPQQIPETTKLENRPSSNPPQAPSSHHKSAQQDKFHAHGIDGGADSTSVSDVEMMIEPESDVAASIESKAPSMQPSSRASTPFAQSVRCESTGGRSHRSPRSPSNASESAHSNSADGATVAIKEAQVNLGAEKQHKKKGVESYGESLRKQEFNWEYQKIFQSPAPFEFVAIAQPLSAKYSETATPVPLLTEKNRKSVSRYARNDNLEEFLRPVRTQSQWSYLQEDPGFLEVSTEGPLIPLDEVRAWMAKRHGEDQHSQHDQGEFSEDGEGTSTRKRERSVDEEENIENWSQNTTKCAIDNIPNKRVKYEEINEDTVLSQMRDSDAAPGTPALMKSGSQSGDEDDVWAPQPGESAVAETDTTEAILASLGVTGSPKPVRSQSFSGGSVHGSAAGESRHGSVVHSMSPAEHAMGMPPHSRRSASGAVSHRSNDRKFSGPGMELQQNAPRGQYANIAPPGNEIRQNGDAPQAYIEQSLTYQSFSHRATSYNGLPPQAPPQQGFSQQVPPQIQNFQQGSHLHGPPPQNQYVNGYAHPNPFPHHVPLQHHQNYPAAPYMQNPISNSIPPHSNGPYPNQHFVTHRQNSFSNISSPQAVSPYGNNMPHHQYQRQNHQATGMQAPHNNGMPPQNGMYGSENYASGPPNQWGPGPPSTPQSLIPYGEPPQPFYNSGHPSGDNQYPQQQLASYPIQGTSPQDHYYPHCNANSNLPPRQDSGYLSARGSYSNGSVAGPGQEARVYDHSPRQPSKRHLNGPIDKASDANHHAADPPEPREPSQVKAEDTASEDEQALSPISREILGKNTTPKKPEPMRQPDDGGTARRKPKRPQPEVAPAYSRRW